MATLDGAVPYDDGESAKAPDKPEGVCPACYKLHGGGKLAQEDYESLINWVSPHVLPETAERAKELELERKQLSEK